MRIEHVALWTSRLEVLEEFYVRFFGAHIESWYRSTSRPFESRFLAFPSGARLELMRLPDLAPTAGPQPRIGLSHLAFTVGSRAEVDRLTAALRQAGAVIEGAPRTTGDGYYESVILDPDGNRVEITA
jgi:catechol 2,3-dioxygenase-like lactoylglutathione lyase family enzyme